MSSDDFWPGFVQPDCNHPTVTWANDVTFGCVIRRLVTFTPVGNTGRR